MTQHTPTPYGLRSAPTSADTTHWFLTARSQGDDARPVDICEVFPICDDGQIGSESHTNALLLRRAANSHEEILRHLRLILEVSDRNDYAGYRQAVREIAQSAITQAEAQP